MAYVYMCGFETGSLTEANAAVTGTASIQTAVVHPGGGNYALRCNPTVGNGYVTFVTLTQLPIDTFCSLRFYLYVAALPNVNITIYSGTSTTLGLSNLQGLILNANGTLSVTDHTGALSTSALKLSTGQWYQISLFVNPINGSNAVAVYVGGVLWSKLTSSANNTCIYDTASIGAAIRETATCDIYIDDILWDDGTTGGVVIGPGAQVILLPTADNSRGAWAGGAGGTTNLFAAVKNVPPVGQAPPGTNTTQIRNGSAAGNNNYIATFQSYNAAGVPVGASINAVGTIITEGVEDTTNTVDGEVWIASNPTQGPINNLIPYGSSAGLALSGAVPDNWFTEVFQVATNPSVNLSQAPTATVRKTTAVADVVDVCFFGIYVDFNTKINMIDQMPVFFQG